MSFLPWHADRRVGIHPLGNVMPQPVQRCIVESRLFHSEGRFPAMLDTIGQTLPRESDKQRHGIRTEADSEGGQAGVTFWKHEDACIFVNACRRVTTEGDENLWGRKKMKRLMIVFSALSVFSVSAFADMSTRQGGGMMRGGWWWGMNSGWIFTIIIAILIIVGIYLIMERR